MRDPQRLLSSSETPSDLRLALQHLERPAPLSPEQSARLVNHIATLSQGSAVTGSVLGTGLAVKAGAAAATVALAGWLTYALRTPPAPPPQPPRAAERVQTSAQPAAPAPTALAAPEARPTVAPAPLRASAAPQETRRATRPVRALSVVETTTQDAPEQDPLAQEERLVEHARAQLQGSPAIALSSLERHRREFQDGQLAAEREFLRVMALKRLGRTGEAEQAAQQLRARFPDTVYAARVSAALWGSDGSRAR